MPAPRSLLRIDTAAAPPLADCLLAAELKSWLQMKLDIKVWLQSLEVTGHGRMEDGATLAAYSAKSPDGSFLPLVVRVVRLTRRAAIEELILAVTAADAATGEASLRAGEHTPAAAEGAATGASEAATGEAGAASTGPGW